MRRPPEGATNDRNRRLTPVWLGWALALALALPAWARAGAPPVLDFSVQDPDGNFFPKGEVEFCLPDGRCLYADIDPGFPGHFSLHSADLVPGGVYTVMVYDPDVDVIYEKWDWLYRPADYDPGFDMLLRVNKFLVYPQFRGASGGRLLFEITTTLNPVWEERAGIKMAEDRPDSVPDYPRFLTGLLVPSMLGARFRSDPEAAGGVLSVSPGYGLDLSWRQGYPRGIAASEDWVPFRELTFAYAGNRYETDEVITPGRTSDVTFHRLTVAYGIGRMSPSMHSHWSVGGAVGLGAVMDGDETLQFLGRTYRMFGFGGRGRVIQEVFGGERVRMGLSAQIDVMYYPAGTDGNDFWHGLAPALAVGVAFY